MRLAATTVRKILMSLFLLLAAFMGVAGQVEASDGMRGDRCVVAETDFIVEDFYFICRVLEVRGTIDGDLIGVASKVTITPTGAVTGDVWVMGGEVLIEGQVGDDIHAASVTLLISDQTQFTNPRTDVLSVGLNTEISQNAFIPGDLLVYGYQAKVAGTVGGDVDFGGEALIIEGRVEGRVDASVGDQRHGSNLPDLPVYDVSFSNPGLRIGNEAFIGSDLKYKAATRSLIPIGVIQGKIDFTQTLSQPDITKAEQPGVVADIMRTYITATLRDILVIVLVGAVGLRFTSNFIRQPALHVRKRAIPAVGWGLVTFMVSFPVVIMLVLISLLILLILYLLNLDVLSLLAVAGVLLLINLSLVGAIVFLFLFLGRVIISFVIGQMVYRYVLRATETGTLRRWIMTLALGAVIYGFVANMPVPWLGLTLELVAILAGIGAVALYMRELALAPGLLSPLPAPVSPAGPRRLPELGLSPPVSAQEEYDIPLGLDNLPEGFTGFDE